MHEAWLHHPVQAHMKLLILPARPQMQGTTLREACALGNAALVGLFLKAGADVNIADGVSGLRLQVALPVACMRARASARGRRARFPGAKGHARAAAELRLVLHAVWRDRFDVGKQERPYGRRQAAAGRQG